MTDTSVAHDQESKRYPLSFTQQWFLTFDQGDDGGAFGRRWLIVSGLRITGHVDLAMLQGALDDVVTRHELLRTLVVRDADPPYQLVYPPCQVPLEVRDLPPVTGTARETVVHELNAEVEAGTMSARKVPLLRALLCRFDDRDSVLFVTVHHSASDGWSVGVIQSDLGAFYAARATGTPPKLPQMRQYHEYAEWQRASADDTNDGGALKYWTEKLSGARETVLPNDHGYPERYTRPYSLHSYLVDADTMTRANDLATAARGTLFMVMLSVIYVLASELTGTTDLAIRVITAGRNDLQFQHTLGLFLNVLLFRTDLADCTSFRDIVLQTRETFIDAIAHELPIGVIEQTFPDCVSPRLDRRMSHLLISDSPARAGAVTLPIAEGAKGIGAADVEETESTDIPSGTVWYLNALANGSMGGGMHFNRDEFEESTVTGWSERLKRILASAVRDPDQDWRNL
jgi:condensation enzyme